MKDTLNIDINKRYTFADYLTWFDDVRRELYDGFVKIMTPAPSLIHQITSGNLQRIIGNFLYGNPCLIITAPSDVRLVKNENKKSDRQIKTVVQPDLYIVCDPNKLDEKGCLGAPDMIIEIISPKNAQRDISEKFKLYQEHGVKEYWIVNPNDENVNVFMLDKDSKYQLVGMYAGNDKIPVNIFEGKLEVDLTEVFDAPFK